MTPTERRLVQHDQDHVTFNVVVVGADRRPAWRDGLMALTPALAGVCWILGLGLMFAGQPCLAGAFLLVVALPITAGVVDGDRQLSMVIEVRGPTVHVNGRVPQRLEVTRSAMTLDGRVFGLVPPMDDSDCALLSQTLASSAALRDARAGAPDAAAAKALAALADAGPTGRAPRGD